MSDFATALAIGLWRQNISSGKANLALSLSHLEQALAEGQFFPETKQHSDSVQAAINQVRSALAQLNFPAAATDAAASLAQPIEPLLTLPEIDHDQN